MSHRKTRRHNPPADSSTGVPGHLCLLSGHSVGNRNGNVVRAAYLMDLLEGPDEATQKRISEVLSHRLVRS
jgi:hypothetical protein